MATVDEKGALDGGATSSLEGNENKPSNGATPTPGSVDDTVVGAQDGAQDGTPEIVYPGTASFSLIALALCLIIYVITLVRPYLSRWSLVCGDQCSSSILTLVSSSPPTGQHRPCNSCARHH